MELRDRHDSAYRGFALARWMSVRTPPLHEGVGDALRRSYAPRADDVPDDMMQLLDQLK
jgi:hypothetical protein